MQPSLPPLPCPNCEMIFETVDDLYNHALNTHSTQHLANVIRREMMKNNLLTWDDFTQVDSHWIYAKGNFHLSVSPDAAGHFRLTVYGSVEPIPPSTQYPTEPEKTKVVDLANKFLAAYIIAMEREQG